MRKYEDYEKFSGRYLPGKPDSEVKAALLVAVELTASVISTHSVASVDIAASEISTHSVAMVELTTSVISTHSVSVLAVSSVRMERKAFSNQQCHTENPLVPECLRGGCLQKQSINTETFNTSIYSSAIELIRQIYVLRLPCTVRVKSMYSVLGLSVFLNLLIWRT